MQPSHAKRELDKHACAFTDPTRIGPVTIQGREPRAVSRSHASLWGLNTLCLTGPVAGALVGAAVTFSSAVDAAISVTTNPTMATSWNAIGRQSMTLHP
jgi:hypothetical protein